MKFEELENLWAEQPAAPTTATDLAALQRTLLPEIKQRGRMLRYGIFLAALGLVISPLLAVANYNYARPLHPTWHWVNLAVWMIVNGIVLLFLIREVRRQQAVLRQSADTVRALTTVALASREAEMRDYRRGLWLVPALLGFLVLNLYLKFPVTAFGWKPFLSRTGFTFGFALLLGSAFWRHYQTNLKPAHARQKAILRDLS